MKNPSSSKGRYGIFAVIAFYLFMTILVSCKDDKVVKRSIVLIIYSTVQGSFLSDIYIDCIKIDENGYVPPLYSNGEWIGWFDGNYYVDGVPLTVPNVRDLNKEPLVLFIDAEDNRLDLIEKNFLFYISVYDYSIPSMLNLDSYKRVTCGVVKGYMPKLGLTFAQVVCTPDKLVDADGDTFSPNDTGIYKDANDASCLYHPFGPVEPINTTSYNIQREAAKEKRAFMQRGYGSRKDIAFKIITDQAEVKELLKANNYKIQKLQQITL